MVKTHGPRNDQRPGVVLLVVIAMLALFAAVALSFVFYAEAEATASRYASQGETQAQADVDPEMLLSYFLSQLIYDTNNPYSAMRGHSLARTMYGLNPDAAAYNNIPFNGIGRLRYDYNHPNLPGQKKNNNVLINYTDFSKGQPVDAGIVRHPETDPNGNYVGGNVHWTYPDLNNMFLAAVNASGEVLIPSFHRPWLGVDPANNADPWAKYMTLRPHVSYHGQFATPDWDGFGDVKNLEWGPGQRNGTGGYANNDSIWMDLGFPVLTAPNGKRYKPLFAPLIVDMDNKLDLYVHGNTMVNVPITSATELGTTATITTAVAHGFSVGQTVTISDVANSGYNGDFIVTLVPGATSFKYSLPAAKLGPSAGGFAMAHFSNQGWGWWEVNLSKLLNRGGVGKELNQLFRGPSIGRYGPNGQGDGKPLGGPANPPFYSPVDFGELVGFDGVNSKYIYYPGDANDPRFPLNRIRPFPSFPANWDNASAKETNNHAACYNALFPGHEGKSITSATKLGTTVTITTAVPHGFTPGQTVRISGNTLIITSVPNTTTFTYTDAAGLGAPSASYVSDDRGALAMSHIEALYRYQGTGSPGLTSDLFAHLPNNMKNARSRWLSTLRTMDFDHRGLVPYITSLPAASYKIVPPATVPTSSNNNFPTFGSSPGGEFDPNGWRSRVYPTPGKLWVRLDSVANYPFPDATGMIPAALNSQVRFANLTRETRASEFYDILQKLTGANPTTDLNGARWLAQLAVNIIDFISDQDYVTVWNWRQFASPGTGDEYVYGTELPQLLINEVYASVDNDPSDAPTAKNYNVNFWVELHNPMSSLVNITSAVQTGIPSPKIVTLTTAAAHNLTAGQTISISGVPVAGYNGTHVVSAVLSNTMFQYDVKTAGLPLSAGGTVNAPFPRDGAGKVYLRTQPTDGSAPQPIYQVVVADTSNFDPTDVANSSGDFKNDSPDFKRPINSWYPQPAINIWSATCVAGTVTIAFLTPHGLVKDQPVSISGVGVAGYNGTFFITAVPTPETFEYVVNAAPLPRSQVNEGGIVRPPGLVDDWLPGLDFVDVANPALPYGPDTTARGFYVMGPKNANGGPLFFAGRDPNFPVTTIGATAANYAGLSWSFPVAKAPQAKTFGVFLKRLAKPHIAFDKITNPYITVDYYGNISPTVGSPVPLNDSRAYTDVGPVLAPPVITNFQSGGRNQPYVNSWTRQNPVLPAVPPPTSPKTTFFRHNGTTATMPTGADATLTTPFYWPVHMDRILVNPLELLNVSCCRPWEYTQKLGLASSAVITAANEVGTTVTITTSTTNGFKAGQMATIAGVGVAGYNGFFTITWAAGNQFAYTVPSGLAASSGGTATVSNDHRAPWDQRDTLLYRLLDAAYTGGGHQSVAVLDADARGQRYSGKINIGTIWDPEILDALVDNPNIKVAAYITAATQAGKNVTITTSAPHGFKADDTVTVSAVGVAGYNGTFVINKFPAPTATTFSYPAAPGLVPSSGGYAVTKTSLFKIFMDSRSPTVVGTGLPGATDDIDFASDGVTTNLVNMNRPIKSLNVGVYGKPIVSATQTGTNVTIATSVAHDFYVGQRITISGVGVDRYVAGYNGTYTITSVPSAATFTYTAAVGGLLTSKGGLASDTQYPNGLGIDNTILRAGLFQQTDNVTAYPGGLPFKRNEVSTKIFNNVTTRSNVFALWLTAGFFEVVAQTDAAGNPLYPAKLGAEIGRTENRHVRHRMFAIIDRTNVMTPDPNTLYAGIGTNIVKSPLPQKVTLIPYTPASPTPFPYPASPTPFANLSWKLASPTSNPSQVNVLGLKLRPGMSLTFRDFNPPETVVIEAVDYNLNQITATFTQPRFAGQTIVTPNFIPQLGTSTSGGVASSTYGNPGPQEAYFDPRQNTLVVPYFSIIQ